MGLLWLPRNEDMDAQQWLARISMAQETGAQAGTNGQTETVPVGNKDSWACKTLCTPSDLLCGSPQTSERCGGPGARVVCTALPSLCSGAHSEFGTVALWIRAVITMVISHKARSQEPTFQSGPIS